MTKGVTRCEERAIRDLAVAMVIEEMVRHRLQDAKNDQVIDAAVWNASTPRLREMRWLLTQSMAAKRKKWQV
ncbi:hypothetical protein AGMMS50289_22550 [Betaproteobacteria bacterium]|nr:hypothetical protein AGMMS50289_22550 [Betaproteobacteria bacterium]